MIAFDADVFTEIVSGNRRFVERAAAVPRDEQCVPVVVVEEIVRARLNMIRQAEMGRARISITRAYQLFGQSLNDLQHLRILLYSPGADFLFQQWRDQRVRVSAHDLRIAAICLDHSATLVSRNRRDFDRVPGLSVEYWD
jgi:tRNA(fMet)-specific endonuclease VapC